MKSGARMVMAAGLVLAVVLASGQGLAQQPAAGAAKGAPVLVIREITGYGPRSLMRSPDAGGSGRGRGTVREWAELRVDFDTAPEWVDEVTFNFYTLHVSHLTKEFTLLKAAVTYVDVARGRGHLAVAYVRPNALARFGEVAGVAVEAVVKGETVATLMEGKLGPSKPLPPKWWTNPKLVPKDGYIVEKAKTPFALLNFDDYEAVK